MELQTHICNSCGKKSETFAFFCGESIFKLCTSCCSAFLQDFFDKMKLTEISDMLKRLSK